MSQQSTSMSRQKVPRHGVSMSRHSVLCRNSGARFHLATRQSVRTTKTLCRALQALGTHNRGGLAHATDQAKRERQTWARARQETTRATEDLCRDRDFSVATNLSNNLKKKNDPRIWGFTEPAIIVSQSEDKK